MEFLRLLIGRWVGDSVSWKVSWEESRARWLISVFTLCQTTISDSIAARLRLTIVALLRNIETITNLC